MSLNVIIGKSNTGKSEYIMKKIMACENENVHAILFVPSSMRVIAEQEYLKYTNKKYITDTEITSIERFVSKNVNKDELYKSKEYLPKLAKRMLVRKIVMENSKDFQIFAKVKENSNFIDKICDYIESAEKQNILSKDMLEAYNEEDFLGKKIQELSGIYKKVEDSLKGKFASSTDELNFYIDQLENMKKNNSENNSENNSKKNIYTNTNVFFDGYNNFSKIEYQYIKRMLQLGAQVTLTLDLDEEKYLSGNMELYGNSYSTLDTFKNLCSVTGIKINIVNLKETKNNRPQDLEHLANNLFDASPKKYDGQISNVKLVLTRNTYDEINYIVNNILDKVQKGKRYSDFTIYTNDILTYHIAITKLFSVYKIPVYFNENYNINSNVLVIYLSLILKLAIGDIKKDITPVIELLKTGLIDVTEKDINLFENYVSEFGIKGYMLKDKLKHNNKENTSDWYNIDVVNDVRTKVLENIQDMKERLKDKKTSIEITQAIYNHLLSKEIITKYENILLKTKETSINEYNVKKQVVSKLYEIMDNISLCYEEISKESYLELLNYGVKEITIDTIPEKLDQVLVCDINKNRGISKKIGYIIGAYDGGLPTVQNEDSIFSDKELKKLKEKNIDLKENSVDRNNMQLFNIYQAVNKVREELIITVPSSKMTGGSLRPSYIIQSIKNILNIKLESANIEDSLNADENFMKFVNKVQNIDENCAKEVIEKLNDEYLVYIKNERYAGILNYLRQDKSLSEKTLNLVYSDKINTSVSRLEQFERCPFAYYSNYLLHLKENKEYAMSSMDTGTFMHEIIEEFSKYIVSRNYSWTDVILNEKINKTCMKELDKIVDGLYNENYGKYLETPKYIVLKNKLKNSMRRTILAIADSFTHSEFRPLGYEVSFDTDGLFAPIEIELEQGKKLYLRGKIDRVDSLNVGDNTYLRIVDYKSSDKNLRLSDVKDGLSLQLMSYMWAMMENKEKVTNGNNVIPAAVTYFTISNKLLNIPNYEKDENKISEALKKALKLRGIYIRDIEVLKKLDKDVEDSKQSYLEVSKYSMNKDEKTLPEQVFIEECNNMKAILRKIGDEIVRGNVKICPNKKLKNVCDYCKYGSFCRKNILN